MAVALSATLSALSFANPVSPAPNAEIAHLFAHLENSHCAFYRNGSWHGAAEAGDHLRKKYEYLQDKGKIDSAEGFIEKAATQSSVSGEPYQVRCGDGQPVASAEWFQAELLRFRDSQP